VRNRRSILLLLMGIALLVFAHVAVRSSGDERRMTGRRRTLVVQQDAFSALKIERRGHVAVEIRRDEDSGWCIVAPFSGRADRQAVARLLDVLSLSPISDVVSDDELARLGRTRADFSLAEPLVRVTLESGKERSVVSFGMPTPSADGVYAAVEGVGAVFVVPSEVLSSVDCPTEVFRRRTLFTALPDSISSFVLRQEKGSSLSFVRENGGWKVDGETASRARVEDFLATLLSAEALDFVWPVGVSNETERASASRLAAFGLDPENAVTVTLKGSDDSDRQLSFGRTASAGRVYASVQSGSAVVTVTEALKTSALQNKSAFTDSRLFPVAESSVVSFRLTDGENAYVFARAGDGAWRVETPVSAPADPSAVRRILARILSLSASAVSDASSGFSVSLSADALPVYVARGLVLGEDRIDDLRSVEMVRIDPLTVKRLVRTPEGKDARPVSVVRGSEGGSWALESSDDGAVVRPEGVAKVLAALNPLVAVRVEKLKVSAADLDGYGLGVPFLTVAVDLDCENAVRRNILVGAKTKGGRFATVGSADAVFVISEETVGRLSAEPVGK